MFVLAWSLVALAGDPPPVLPPEAAPAVEPPPAEAAPAVEPPPAEAAPAVEPTPPPTDDPLDRNALVELLQREIRKEIRAELAATRVGFPAPTDATRSGFGGPPVRVEAGEVVEDAVGFGSPVVVAGRVTGDVTAFGADVHVLPTGVVDGDAVSFGGTVRVDDGGIVWGSQVGMGPGHRSPDPLGASARTWIERLIRRLVVFLSFAGAGIFVVSLFPNRVAHIAARIRHRPASSLVLGTIATTGLLLGSFVFGITLVGLPIAFLLVSLLGLAWLMGFVGLCQAVGDRLPFQQKVHGRWLAFLAGTLLVAFLGTLPIVGIAAVIVASVLGIGAALTTRLGVA